MRTSRLKVHAYWAWTILCLLCVWSLGGNQNIGKQKNGCTPFFFIGMKRTLLSLIIMLTVASMHSQSDFVILYLKDGTKLKMLLSESPSITYDKYNVSIITTAFSAKYAMTDIDKLSLGEYVPSEIENVKNNEAKIYYSGEKVELRGFSNGHSVDVYDTSGKRINHFSTSSDGALSIDVSSYSRGMYVIKTKGLTYKIIR